MEATPPERFEFQMRVFHAFILAACCTTVAWTQTGDATIADTPFKTDKCTMFPDGNYADCCIEHDRDYHAGGSLKERSDSDKRLKQCVRSKGKGWRRRFLANMIWVGVRVGGVHFLPTPFRWGFGHHWPRKEPRTPAPKPTPH
ncbi:MAG: hypothetical protein WKF34_02000 [Pyrinomonadaceae bacterium]